MKGKTSTGFEFEINLEVLDDWELFESFQEIEMGNFLYIVNIAKKILGDEQYNKLKNHVKEKDGKITGTAMNLEITEIMQSSQELKN